MIKKIFVILSLSTFIINLSFATDLLAFYTNGKLTENSPGVKVLSLDEKKSVKGGYMILQGHISIDEYAVFAIPNNTTTYNQAVAIYSVTGDDTLSNIFLGYRVKRNISYSGLKPFVYFTYGVVLYDKNGYHKVNMSSTLNNNLVIKQLSNQYKVYMENKLGGWSVR